MNHHPIHGGQTRGPQKLKQTRSGSPRRADVAQGWEDPGAGPRARTRHRCPMQPRPARPLTWASSRRLPTAPRRLTATGQPAGRPRGRLSGVGPVLRAAWKGLFSGPPPAPARSAPPRPSGPASYLHGPDQAPAGQLALPQLQQNVTGPRPAAPSAPSRHRCRCPSPSAGPRPRRRRRRHVSSSDKQEASGPGAAEISTGWRRGRRSAPSGPTAEAQAAWQKPYAPRSLLGNVVLLSVAAGAKLRCDVSCATCFWGPWVQHFGEVPRGQRQVPACALSHFLPVSGRLQPIG